MTVKQAVQTLATATKIDIVWDGCTIALNTNNDLMMDAFSNYTVKEIAAPNKANEYELIIKATPEKSN